MESFQKIKIKTENILGESVLEIVSVTNRLPSNVYLIKTESSKYIFKIFKSSVWPEPGKLQIVEKLLNKKNILNPKNIYIAREDRDFEHGFVLQDYISGSNGRTEIRKKNSSEKYFFELGKLLKKVHSIELEGYGHIAEDQKFSDTPLKFLLKEFKRHENKLIEKNIFDKRKIEEIRKTILSDMSPFEKLPPVLSHGDISSNNVVLVGNELVLIDWDNSLSSIWIDDYAYITYWMNFIEDEEKKMIYKTNFLSGYGIESKKEIAQAEEGLHLVTSAKLLSYYEKGTKNFNMAMSVNKKILKSKNF